MLPYVSKNEAIEDLHRRGFNNDFQLFGNDLLWVQEKIFIRMADFEIAEYHHLLLPQSTRTDSIVFGVISNHHHVKGILLNDYSAYILKTPSVIEKKINELNRKTDGGYNL